MRCREKRPTSKEDAALLGSSSRADRGAVLVFLDSRLRGQGQTLPVEVTRTLRLIQNIDNTHAHLPASGQRPIDALANRQAEQRAADGSENRYFPSAAVDRVRIAERQFE